MSSQVASDLVAATEKYQAYISGLAAWNPSSIDQPYIEQTANVAMTLDESLATDYDGTLRFAPAWPSGGTPPARVYIQGGSKVDVQVEGGTLATAAIAAGTTGTMTVRNPWPGQQAEVVNGSTAAVVVSPTSNATLSVPVTAGQSYLVEQAAAPTTSLPFAQVTGTQATTAKHLGGVKIGLDGGSGTGGATGPITSGANSAKCVDDSAGSTANGNKIQMWDCQSGNPNQSWTVASNGTVQVFGKCLDITGASNGQRRPDRAVAVQRRGQPAVAGEQRRTGQPGLRQVPGRPELQHRQRHPARPVDLQRRQPTSNGTCPDVA